MPHLPNQPAHLGPGGAVTVEPPFTGMEWYADYAARHDGDGAEGRLVSMYDFAESWDSWEMHPAGAELVICTAGSITLVQEHPDGRVDRVTLGPATMRSIRRASGTRRMSMHPAPRCSSRRGLARSTAPADPRL